MNKTMLSIGILSLLAAFPAASALSYLENADVTVCPTYNPDAWINTCNSVDVKPATSTVNVPTFNGIKCTYPISTVCVPTPNVGYTPVPVERNGAEADVYVEFTMWCYPFIATASTTWAPSCYVQRHVDSETILSSSIAISQLLA